ncbi:MAG TPA: hypothetical protein VM888_13485, partial [Chitinophagaceae bacterium]|nr:hypothetical protein [Chitinophagaceae bacterium]
MDDLVYNEHLLIRYLDGELGSEEKTALESRLQTDKVLLEQLTNLKVAEQAVKHFGTVQQVALVHAQMMQELRSKKANVFSLSKTVRYTLAFAASMLILFVGIRVYEAAQLSPQKLYAETFVDFNISGTRGSNTELSEIEEYYRKGEYAAITDSVRSTHLYAKDSLLIGLAYLQTGRTDKAISFFRKLAFSDNDFRQDAEFYLSLSYLKNKA